MLSTSAPARPTISSTSSRRVRHHRQRAERERRVGRLVHDDVVRDLVDERPALAQPRAAIRPAFTQLRSHVEDVDRARRPRRAPARPCRTASEAARAAPRAASSSERPRASSAASVAECVQPAPCVARDVVPLDRDLDVLAPSKRWSTAGVAVAAGDDHGRRAELVQPLGELAPRCLAARERDRLGRFGVTTVASGNSRATSALDRVVLEQLRARARDHHRVDDERHRVLLEVVRDRLDQPPREEHPGLRGVDADVREHRVELRDDELRRQLVDRRHRGRVLRRERDEHRHPVRAGGGERLQVGLDAGAAAASRRLRSSVLAEPTALPSPA